MGYSGVTFSSTETSERISDIIDALREIKGRDPKSLPEVREGRIAATKSVARRKNINEESVRDKCWRQLDFKVIEEFDTLVHDWIVNGSSELRQRLIARASLRNREGDMQAIEEFFGEDPSAARVSWWWVNQGRTYSAERKGNYIWAPQRGKDGQEIFHHVNVSKVKAGDVIFHYVDGNIVATSVAEEAATSAARPAELPADAWDREGFMVRVRYHELQQAVPKDSIPADLRSALAGESKSPFNKGGNVNQGYLFSLTDRFVAGLLQHFPQMLPPGVAPPIVSAEAELRRFIDDIIRLRVDKENGSPRLYKPALLYSIVEGLDENDLVENQFRFDQVVPRFIEALAGFGKPADEKHAAAAFFHMQNEPFWRLKLKRDGEPPLRGEPAQLRNQVEYGFFLPPYWRVLSNADSRRQIKQTIIDHWFKGQRSELQTMEEFDYATSVARLIGSIDKTGFRFEPWQIACYITALRTKPFLILAGVSGSGKSQLPQLVANATGGKAELIPVRPDWTDSSDVLGYVQLQGRLRPGPLLRLAKQASASPDRHFVCIVDEMNLARVEHYFAEILSRVEEARSNNGISGRLLTQALSDEDREWEEVALPANLAVVGTVNMDESTHGFSRKVLDRAFTLEFSEIDLSSWESSPDFAVTQGRWPEQAWNPRATRLAMLSALSAIEREQVTKVIETLVEINELLSQAQLQLAYRSRDEIVLFVLHANDVIESFVTRDGAKIDPLDLALQMKVLPRIAGGSAAIRRLLLHLLGWSWSSAATFKDEEDASALLSEWTQLRKPHFLSKARFPRTCARLCLMWERILHEGYTSFWL